MFECRLDKFVFSRFFPKCNVNAKLSHAIANAKALDDFAVGTTSLNNYKNRMASTVVY